MNCVIPGQNLKVMGKAIHALAKIGDELYLQASEDEMSIRTMNMSKTAYAIVKFLPPFFTIYSVESSESNQSTQAEELKCKMPMKAILSVFKSPVQMEKQIEICKIELQYNSTKIIFKFRYKHDINKTQSVWLLEGESLQMVYLSDGVPNVMSSPAILYTQALANFQNTDDEVSLEVNPQKIIMRNYIEGENSKIHHVRSQLSLNPSEFDSYKISLDTSVTFSLKPFRAAIHFAEYFNMGMTINFQSSGKPAVLIISNVIFDANFVLATFHGGSDTQSTIAAPSVKRLPSPVSIKTGAVNLTLEEKAAIDKTNWEKNFDNSGTDDFEEEVFVIPDSPESPRSKRIKFLFKRCFEPTFNESQLQADEVVLAENSDTEC